MINHYTMYIDGKWIDSGDAYEIRSPADEELVATVAKGTVEHVDAAVNAAKDAFAEGSWRRTPPAERAALIETVAARLAARSDELAALQARENGATIRITGALHVGLSVAQLQYLAAVAREYEWETAGPAIEPVPADGLVVREPIGVVAAIVPWNIPLLTTVWKIGPALAAGNSVVLKPDEHAPLLPLELVREFDAAGLPPGVLNLVTGDGEPVGAHLSGHPEVRKVAFTGSTAVGKSILRQSADAVRRVTLELGVREPTSSWTRPTWTWPWTAHCSHAWPTTARPARPERGCWCRRTGVTRSSRSWWPGRRRYGSAIRSTRQPMSDRSFRPLNATAS